MDDPDEKNRETIDREEDFQDDVVIDDETMLLMIEIA